MLGTVPSSERHVPESLQSDLRQVHPRYRLHHVVEDRFWLLWYNPNPQSRASGHRTACRMLRDRRPQRLITDADRAAWQQAQLQLAGWQMVGEYRFRDIPRDYLVSEARLKVRASEAEIERAYAEKAFAASTEGFAARRDAKLQDFFQSEGGRILRHAKRKAS